ncbi:hypothetical protein RHO12_03115 [Orbus sturtevantii]|uniref:hypothetical protein n=1 Tax=Orbus sturtevantii TaxID=3074109 RepID=UPI00370D6877
MDKFPRDKQNELLIMLYNVFPDYLTEEQFNKAINMFGSDINFMTNVWYLYSHGLIEQAVTFYSDDGYSFNKAKLKITRDGIDFIRNDGGLKAILNITTIKIHDDTIEKLTEIINKSQLSEAEKKTFVGKLKELPADATKHLVFELLSKGLSHVPDAFQIISSYIHS